jgi:hypothetical protein
LDGVLAREVEKVRLFLDCVGLEKIRKLGRFLGRFMGKTG